VNYTDYGLVNYDTMLSGMWLPCRNMWPPSSGDQEGVPFHMTTI